MVLKFGNNNGLFIQEVVIFVDKVTEMIKSNMLSKFLPTPQQILNQHLHQLQMRIEITNPGGFREFKLFFEPRDECALLFTQINCQGTPYSLCSSKANFAQERIPSQIKSFNVPPQGKVTLYSNNHYFGKKFVFTEGTPQINEDVYSFEQVEKSWIETQEI